MADQILTSAEAGVCTLVLNRPEKRNAVTVEMIGSLHTALDRIAARDDVRVLVVRGAGSVFCAGLDLRELAAQREAGGVETHSFERALEKLEACPQPTIAVVQGDAVAGGCELALHCDLRVASDDARFSMPLARIGIAVPVALSWKLVDTIGAAATKELLFTGEAVVAQRALALGLVNRVVRAAGLEAAARALAEQIAANAPLSLRAMKTFVGRAIESRRGEHRRDLEELFRRVQASADAREGLAAQRERRKPSFRGE